MILQAIKKKFFLFIFVLILSFSGISAETKSLYWDKIEIKAFLDNSGVLHIREYQTYIFNGDWNGGERYFDLPIGQEFNFTGISRFDQKKNDYIKLVKNNIDLTDNYEMTGTYKIRWRSKLANDPPFSNTKITYLLEYNYAYILKKEKGKYILNHDFLFTDRNYPVKEYFLELNLDSNWNSAYTENKIIYRQKNIEAQCGHTLKLEIDFKGNDPAKLKISEPLSLIVKFFGIFFTTLITFYFIYTFYKSEKNNGRFEPIPVYENPSSDFLKNNLFVYMPEEVGALWDERIDAREVSALIARLVLEKKIKTEFTEGNSILNKKILQLELLTDRENFTKYERKIINGLFVENRNITNTNIIQNYYKKKSKSFSPVSKVEEFLNNRFKNKSELQDHELTDRGWRTSILLFIAGIVLLIFAFIMTPGHTGFPGLILCMLITFFFIFGIIIARLACSQLIGNKLKILLMVYIITSLPFYGFIIGNSIIGESLQLLPFLPCLFFILAANKLLLYFSRTKNSPEKLEIRRKLTGIRNYFKKELANPEPNLNDDWFPYLVAFGLANYIDDWFKNYGNQKNSSTSKGTSSTYSETSSWSGGGGGCFGGAGASGTWASAAAAVSSAASYSSSSSSSGGGSSGGGGGGGW